MSTGCLTFDNRSGINQHLCRCEPQVFSAAWQSLAEGDCFAKNARNDNSGKIFPNFHLNIRLPNRCLSKNWLVLSIRTSSGLNLHDQRQEWCGFQYRSNGITEPLISMIALKQALSVVSSSFSGKVIHRRTHATPHFKQAAVIVALACWMALCGAIMFIGIASLPANHPIIHAIGAPSFRPHRLVLLPQTALHAPLFTAVAFLLSSSLWTSSCSPGHQPQPGDVPEPARTWIPSP